MLFVSETRNNNVNTACMCVRVDATKLKLQAGVYRNTVMFMA